MRAAVACAALAAVSAAVALAGTWSAPPEEAGRANPRAATAESLARGRMLYDETCALCHAESGAGDADMSDTLGVPVGDLTDRVAMARRTDGDLHWRIRVGDEVMPPFSDIFDDDELWDIVNHVRTLAVDDDPEREPDPPEPR